MRFMIMRIFENSMISEDIHLSHRKLLYYTVQFMIHATRTDSSQVVLKVESQPGIHWPPDPSSLIGPGRFGPWIPGGNHDLGDKYWILVTK